MNMFSRSEKTFDSSADNPTARPNGESSASTADNVKRNHPSFPARADFIADQVHGLSVISKAVKVTGQVESSEDIQIDGEVLGDVRGNVIKIGKGAKINGTVYGQEVDLAGTIEGNIESKKIVLANTARISGDLVHQELTIEAGAFIDGRCRPEFRKGVERDSHSVKPAPTGHERPVPKNSVNTSLVS